MSRPLDDRTRTLSSGSAGAALPVLIRVTNAPASPGEYRLESGSCRLGAGSDANIVVGDETVSRLHVEFTLTAEGVRVKDLGSRNGTFYLGQRLEAMTLALGSRVRAGLAEIALDVDRETLDRMQPAEMTTYGRLIGTSPQMRRLFAVLLRLEGSLSNVLVQGESGTGKELVARAIHEHSLASEGPFIAVNCGTLDRALARSELFGHRKGSFTGALDAHVGAFEAASGGTLFLDEIGELPSDVQPMLLRALEVGAITRVGENQERPVKVRVLAATNRDLAVEASQGTFRQDLYYRLAVVTLHVPPLRDRPDDVEALARSLAQELGIAELLPDVLREFRKRAWPGNARELRNALEAYAAIGVLPAAASSVEPFEAALARWLDGTAPYAPQKDALLGTFQRLYVHALLLHTGGNQSEAARISGLDRSYLSKVLSKLV